MLSKKDQTSTQTKTMQICAWIAKERRDVNFWTLFSFVYVDARSVDKYFQLLFFLFIFFSPSPLTPHVTWLCGPIISLRDYRPGSAALGQTSSFPGYCLAQLLVADVVSVRGKRERECWRVWHRLVVLSQADKKLTWHCRRWPPAWWKQHSGIQITALKRNVTSG